MVAGTGTLRRGCTILMKTYADIKHHEDLHYAVRNGIMSVNEAMDLEKERALLADRVMCQEEEDWFESHDCF